MLRRLSKLGSKEKLGRLPDETKEDNVIAGWLHREEDQTLRQGAALKRRFILLDTSSPGAPTLRCFTGDTPGAEARDALHLSSATTVRDELAVFSFSVSGSARTSKKLVSMMRFPLQPQLRLHWIVSFSLEPQLETYKVL